MKSNLLLNEIVLIQNEYRDLLLVLLPKLKASLCPEALDEINLFWIRNMDVVRLYLRTMFSGNESYVFTAATFLGFNDKEHLPFLLMGDKHVLDDPLCKDTEVCNCISVEKDSKLLYKQIIFR